MKKKCLLWISALLIILAGCSTDDEIEAKSEMLKPGDSVLVYAVNDKEVTALYEPVPYQDMPEWLQTMVDGKSKFYILYLHIYQGERNGETIYFICKETDNTIGTFYNKNGDYLQPNTDYLTFFSETSNWKLIFYYDYKLEYKTFVN